MIRPDEDPVVVVRREERLHVATTTVPLEKVRVERHIVTEQRTFTVDVRREELRITRTPISEDTPAPAGNAPSGPIVIVLHEEQVTLTTTVVPVEKVTVEVSAVTREHRVKDRLRREEIDIVERALPQNDPTPPTEAPSRQFRDRRR